MEYSRFSDMLPHFESMESVGTHGATSDTYRVKLYGKLHFLKRLKAEHVGDIRYQEAQRKEFETGYRLEHPNLVRYITLTDDGILMEYVDGETLAERLDSQPEYFTKHTTEKFLRQLLDAVSYLHSHQVLHLDLKPENIILTRINSDVKLIDLGCCYTDTFADTQGRTKGFAAPEQLTSGSVDERTDIYAIGKIIELLPNHHLYNKVVARCTAENPAQRYQSVDELLHAINFQRRYYLWFTVLALVALLLAVGIALVTHQEPAPAVIEEVQKDTIVTMPKDTVPQAISVPVEQPKRPVRAKENSKQLSADMDRMMDEAYHATIATFCDSVFPSPSTGKAWAKASSEFQSQSLEVCSRLHRKYPDIPEATLYQDVQSRFQHLTTFVFNTMRENGRE